MGSPLEWINGLLPYFIGFGALIWAISMRDKLDHLEKRVEELEDLMESKERPDS